MPWHFLDELQTHQTPFWVFFLPLHTAAIFSLQKFLWNGSPKLALLIILGHRRCQTIGSLQCCCCTKPRPGPVSEEMTLFFKKLSSSKRFLAPDESSIGSRKQFFFQKRRIKDFICQLKCLKGTIGPQHPLQFYSLQLLIMFLLLPAK